MDEAITISSTKVQPECSYFGSCGGCSFQDLEYSEQLELKRKCVEDALRIFGAGDIFQIHPTVPSPQPYHYRHMIALSVKRRSGMFRLGFVGQDRKTFIPIESCPISDERINAFLPQALPKLEELPPKKRFRTSQMVLRVGSGGEVVTSLRSDRGKYLECQVGGKSFSYSVSSFFQNNFSVLESFIQTVRTSLNPNSKGTLLDLYSGVGLFGISLADSYQQVIGIEEGYEAVQYAKQNAEQNHVRNISFVEGKVEALLPEVIVNTSAPLHVVIDPPRVGLKPEVIECLRRVPIETLVYVSCSLEALKRDLQLLTEFFTIVSVQPLDLFPQTKHVENIVLLKPH